MRLDELLLQLDPLCEHTLLSGLAPQAALDAAAAVAHPHALAGEILRLWLGWCRLESAAATVARSPLVDALGPLRRRAMADELSPEEFRLLNRVVEGIDAAFDAQSLRENGGARGRG